MLLEAETVTVKTRFGEHVIDRESLVTFPLGLIGFGDCRHFALIDLPEERGRSFKLLQCIDQPELGFTVIPLEAAEGGLDARDLAEAAEHYEIPAGVLAILLIVTAHRAADGVELTANLRAPILLDTLRRRAFQHVMPNDTYPLRHPLI